MKKAFFILRARPEVSIKLTRDSCCAADDCDAPHEKEVKVRSFFDPEMLARETAKGYLPKIAGVGHSWVCVLNGVQIAIVKTNGVRPLVEEVQFDDQNSIHFIYNSARY